MSAFALLIRPADLTIRLQPLTERSSTIRPLESGRIRSFGYRFSPVTSSAQADSTSELLRFL